MIYPFSTCRQFQGSDGRTYTSGEVWQGEADIAGIGAKPIIDGIRVQAWTGEGWVEVDVPRGCEIWNEIAAHLAACNDLPVRFEAWLLASQPRRRSCADEHRLGAFELLGRR